MKKRVLSFVLFISINPLMGAEIQNTTSGVLDQEEKQLDSGEFSRFNRMLKWLEQNKGCLTGVSCSDWVSFTANYILGVAIQLGQKMIFDAAGNVYLLSFKALVGRERTAIAPILAPILMNYWQEYKEAMKQKNVAGMNIALDNALNNLRVALTGLKSADIAGIVGELVFFEYVRSLTEKAIQLGYETIVTKTDPLSWRQTGQCLISGRGCTGDQRRKAFFIAGRASGFLGALAYSRLSSRQKAE